MANLFTRKMSIGELIVVFVVLVPLLAVSLSVFTHQHHPSRATARRVQDMSNLRQISLAVTSYAVDNVGFGPGLGISGDILDATVEHRYQLLVDSEYISSDTLISVYDDKTSWTTEPISSDHYSYAMLQLPTTGGRLSQWRMDADAEAVLLSGRNTGTDATSGVNSIQEDYPGEWRGPVAWGDTHITSESTPLIDTQYFQDGSTNIDDNLFDPAGTDDAYMIYTGD